MITPYSGYSLISVDVRSLKKIRTRAKFRLKNKCQARIKISVQGGATMQSRRESHSGAAELAAQLCYLHTQQVLFTKPNASGHTSSNFGRVAQAKRPEGVLLGWSSSLSSSSLLCTTHSPPVAASSLISALFMSTSDAVVKRKRFSCTWEPRQGAWCRSCCIAADPHRDVHHLLPRTPGQPSTAAK